MIERQVQPMVRLIGDLTGPHRASAGGSSTCGARASLADALANAVETSGPYIEQNGHTLTVSAPADPLVVDADATRLVQVIANLLAGAAKFTPHGGRIELSLARSGAWTRRRHRSTTAASVSEATCWDGSSICSRRSTAHTPR